MNSTATRPRQIVAPTVHMNGTSADDLCECRFKAINSLIETGEALAQCYPNGRDYYPQEAGAIETAMQLHRDRMQSLRDIIDDLEAEVDAIS